jgi:hypothetical protein
VLNASGGSVVKSKQEDSSNDDENMLDNDVVSDIEFNVTQSPSSDIEHDDCDKEASSDDNENMSKKDVVSSKEKGVVKNIYNLLFLKYI